MEKISRRGFLNSVGFSYAVFRTQSALAEVLGLQKPKNIFRHLSAKGASALGSKRQVK